MPPPRATDNSSLVNWGGYWLLAGLVVLFALSFATLPSSFLSESCRSVVWAFVFGTSVGLSEIVSRYRDEPLRAVGTPFGLIYVFVNGMLAVFALFVITRYPEKFGFTAGQPVPAFLSALLAGFGSMAVMRTRLMVLKGADNKDISIGPDLVIKTLLQMVDQYVDRDRAAKRLRIVTANLGNLKILAVKLRSFRAVADYLLASLFAFQNLDEERKKQLQDIFSEYDNKPQVPDDIKYLAMGFVFLTVVGEKQFADLLNKAVEGIANLRSPVAPPLLAPPVLPPPVPPVVPPLPPPHH
jgi:hypothetical protein